MMAAFWWMQHEGGYHLFGTTHHVLTGAPFGWDEGNGLNLQLLLPYYPAYLATKLVGPIAGVQPHAPGRATCSRARSMYLLARYLDCGRVVAAWAGAAYIVFPWHLARTPHGSLVHLEFLPLLLLALVAAARRPTWLRFSLVGLVTLACWLTSGYFGVMAVVAAIAFALFVAFTSPLRRGAALSWRDGQGGAIGASLVVGVLSIISGFGRGAGLHRVPVGPRGVRRSSARASPSRRPETSCSGTGREGIFDGSPARLEPDRDAQLPRARDASRFALAWLVVAWRSRRHCRRGSASATAGLAGVFVVALLLALPSPISVLGHDIWMPSRLLWEVIPAVRVPSRWIALVMTASSRLRHSACRRLGGTCAATTGRRVAYALRRRGASFSSSLELDDPPHASALRDVPGAGRSTRLSRGCRRGSSPSTRSSRRTITSSGRRCIGDRS